MSDVPKLSKPLKRIYDYLDRHRLMRRVTTREISTACHVEAVSTRISHLNKKLAPYGEVIDCERIATTADGGKIFGYALLKTGKQETALAESVEESGVSVVSQC